MPEQVPSENLQICINRIADQTLTAFRRCQDLGIEAPYLTQAASCAASACGWRGDPPLEEWLQEHHSRQTTPHLQECVHRITTAVLTLWYQANIEKDDVKTQHLARALPMVASMNGRCEGLSQGQWLARRIAIRSEPERALAVDTLHLMLESAPDPQQFLPALQSLLQHEGKSQLIRAQTVAMLARVGPAAIGSQAVLSSLHRLLQGHLPEEGYVPLSLLNPPGGPEAISAQIESLRYNDPARFTWITVAAALGQIGEEGVPPDILLALQARLNDRVWVVGAVAAETLAQCHRMETTLRLVLQEIKGDRREQRIAAARMLGRMNCMMPSSEGKVFAALQPLFEEGDLILRATILESVRQIQDLTSMSEKPPHDPQIVSSALRRLFQKPGKDHREALNDEEINRRWRRRSPLPERRIESCPLSVETSNAGRFSVHLGSACVVFVDPVWINEAEVKPAARAEEWHRLEAVLRQMQAYRSARGDVEWVPYQKGIALAFFGTAFLAIRCAIEVARAYKHHPHIGVRVGLVEGFLHLSKNPEGYFAVEPEGLRTAERIARCGNRGHLLLSPAIDKAMVQSALEVHLGSQIKVDSCLSDWGVCQVAGYGSIALCNLSAPRGEFGQAMMPGKVTPERLALKPVRRKRNWLRPIAKGVYALILLGIIGLAVPLAIQFHYEAHKPDTTRPPSLNLLQSPGMSRIQTLQDLSPFPLDREDSPPAKKDISRKSPFTESPGAPRPDEALPEDPTATCDGKPMDPVNTEGEKNEALHRVQVTLQGKTRRLVYVNDAVDEVKEVDFVPAASGKPSVWTFTIRGESVHLVFEGDDGKPEEFYFARSAGTGSPEAGPAGASPDSSANTSGGEGVTRKDATGEPAAESSQN